MAQAIHIHEDDWGMRSLHPVAAWPEVSADVARAVEAGERNRATDGIGWTGMHVVGEPALDFTSCGLGLADLAARLGRIMPRVQRFAATATAGLDPSHHDPLGHYQDDAWCFGLDAACFIKLEPSGDLVRRIWFEARTGDAARLGALRQALLVVDAHAEAMVVDYWADAAGKVRDGAFMERYFRWLAEG